MEACSSVWKIARSLGRSTPSDKAEEHARDTVRCNEHGPACKLRHTGRSSHVSRII